MKLSGTERETIVLYNEAEAAASIYTHNAALCRQLSELCGTYPGQVRQTGDNGYGGLSFELPKNTEDAEREKQHYPQMGKTEE